MASPMNSAPAALPLDFHGVPQHKLEMLKGTAKFNPAFWANDFKASADSELKTLLKHDGKNTKSALVLTKGVRALPPDGSSADHMGTRSDPRRKRKASLNGQITLDGIFLDTDNSPAINFVTSPQCFADCVSIALNDAEPNSFRKEITSSPVLIPTGQELSQSPSTAQVWMMWYSELLNNCS